MVSMLIRLEKPFIRKAQYLCYEPAETDIGAVLELRIDVSTTYLLLALQKQSLLTRSASFGPNPVMRAEHGGGGCSVIQGVSHNVV